MTTQKPSVPAPPTPVESDRKVIITHSADKIIKK